MLRPALLVPALLLAACGATGSSPKAPAPFAIGRPADHLIKPGERHFAHLWQLTFEGENAEAYWSPDGEALIFQRRDEDAGVNCDRIYVLRRDDTTFRQVSSGRGVTTCSYFLPDGQHVVYASTQGAGAACPPPIDPKEFQRLGYFWRVFPEYDLWTSDLDGENARQLTSEFGYDAEATVSPRGDRIVFTSTRTGDVELWTSDLSGGDLRQVTHTPGYDGGAFFSNDGKKLLWRSQGFTPGKEAEEQAFHAGLLKEWKVNPLHMELQIADADGTNRRTIRELGGANFAPFFFPDDSRVIFSTNHHDPHESKREFDLFAVDVDGQDLEQVTTHQGFDSFPVFSPDGRYLVFASNRGQSKPGNTNLFVALWQ